MPAKRNKAISPQPINASPDGSTHLEEQHSGGYEDWTSSLPDEACREVLGYLTEVVVQRGPICLRALAAGAFDALTGLFRIAVSGEVPGPQIHESEEDARGEVKLFEADSDPSAQFPLRGHFSDEHPERDDDGARRPDCVMPDRSLLQYEAAAQLPALRRGRGCRSSDEAVEGRGLPIRALPAPSAYVPAYDPGQPTNDQLNKDSWRSARLIPDIAIHEMLKWLAKVVTKERGSVCALAACASDSLSGIVASDWPTDYAELNMEEAVYLAEGAVHLPAIGSVVILTNAKWVGNQTVN